MPKLNKTSKSTEENKTAWRTPVKLPANVNAEPMRLLYHQSDDIKTLPETETVIAKNVISEVKEDAPSQNPVREISNSVSEIKTVETKNRTLPLAAPPKRQRSEAKAPPVTDSASEKNASRRSEADFLRLLKTEKMDFYSLAEILRGSSMALYCVLYSESLAKGNHRCQIRQTELMMRAGINNPATLYKQERWLTALGLINKSVRLGNHNGASYEVQPLDVLPLPNFILAQFDGYLTKLV